MPADEAIVETLKDGTQVSLTLQMTLNTVRSVFNAPDGTSALMLAALAANLMQTYTNTLNSIYKEAEKAGISPEQFAAVIKSAFVKEAVSPDKSDDEPDIHRG